MIRVDGPADAAGRAIPLGREADAAARRPGQGAAVDGKAVYVRLLGHVLPYRRTFAIGVAAMVVLGLTEPAIPAILERIIGSFEAQAFDGMPFYAALFLGMFFVRGLSSFFSMFALESVAARIVMDLRREMFDRLMRIPVPAYEDVSSGSLISKVTFDTQQVTGAATHAVTVLVRDSIAVLGLLGWMLWIDWILTLIVLAAAPPVVVVVVYFSRRLRRTSHGLQRTMGDVTHVLQEGIEGHKVVKVFSGQAYETRRFTDAATRARRFQIKFAAAAAAMAPIAQMATALALAIILLLSARRLEGGTMTISDFVSFFTAMALLFAPVKRLTRINAQVQQGIAAAASVFTLIDASVETDAGPGRIRRAEGRLALESVTFRYRSASRPALDRVSIAIEPGETVALVGPSGSGKTTVAGLIPRFHDPESGRVRLDGVDVRDLTLESLRANVALVSQDIVLFEDTVAANIAYGGAAADATREAVTAAARAAHALEFIEAMPQGLDTLIGERGVKLSGGQRQRLAIARAVLKDAPILILDEATSSLDSESERHIREAVETLRAGRTTLVIAHRLSTIEGADRIVVMDRGRVADTGTHAELLARNGLYTGLCRFQFFRRERPARQAAGHVSDPKTSTLS